MIPSLFFDTANISAISQYYTELVAHDFPASAIIGITTNPSALSKVHCTTLSEFEKLIPQLCALVTDMRGDNLGEVHAQLPYSYANETEIVEWAKYIQQFSDGHTRVAMKVPPYPKILKFLEEAPYFDDIILNVTGITDAATILLCGTYPAIRYASIIPGRMEETGINADTHLQFLNDRHLSLGAVKVISGSMRTLEGLQKAIRTRTIPTIGERVWNLFTDNDFSQFANWWNTPNTSEEYPHNIPEINTVNRILSAQFFLQMDMLGSPIFKQFQDSIK